MKAISDTDKAYLAGIIDGEGCISVAIELGKRIQPYLEIANADKELITHIRKLLPKPSLLRKWRGKGRNRKVYYAVFLHGADRIREVLKETLPYLVSKRRVAELMIEYCKRRNHNILFLPKSERGYCLEDLKLVCEIRKEIKKNNSRAKIPDLELLKREFIKEVT